MAKVRGFAQIPRESLPKAFRALPDAAAMEMYAYSAVARGPGRMFYKEYEESLRAAEGTRDVEFRVLDAVLFFATAAASGIIGNFAYAAIVAAVKKVRRPKKEFGSESLRFESVVSRQTYNRVRRQKHHGPVSRKAATEELEQELQIKYRLIVKLSRD